MRPRRHLRRDSLEIGRIALFTTLLIVVVHSKSIQAQASPRACSIPPFPDVSSEHWACPHILALTQESGRIIRGRNDGLFHGQDPVRRAEFVAMIVRLTLGNEPARPQESPYQDVPLGEWYTPYIAFAAERQWIDSSEANFFPSNAVTRAVAATILIAAAEKQNIVIPANVRTFSDDGDIPNFARHAMYLSLAGDLIEGFIGRDCNGNISPGSVYGCPNIALTRYQAAVLIWRFREIFNSRAEIPNPDINADGEESLPFISISPGITSMGLSPGGNFFKFDVLPEKHFGFAVYTGSQPEGHYHRLQSRSSLSILLDPSHFQADVYGLACVDFNVVNNESYAASAVKFFSDADSRTVNYIHLSSTDAIESAELRLTYGESSKFGLPFRRTHMYYNTFGHRAVVGAACDEESGTPTINGHAGVDIVPLFNDDSGGDINYSEPVRAIAGGQVLEARNIPGNRYGIWVRHEIEGQVFTSLYAHLGSVNVSRGDMVVRGQELGLISTVEKHLHLEIFTRETTVWSHGYPAILAGQVDPIPELFNSP